MKLHYVHSMFFRIKSGVLRHMIFTYLNETTYVTSWAENTFPSGGHGFYTVFGDDSNAQFPIIYCF